jgi:dihydrofolate reductase
MSVFGNVEVMRRLIVTENMSLDGVIAPMEGWFDPSVQGDDLLATTRQHSAASDALLVGRSTFEEMAGYWPKQADDRTGITSYLNEVNKYVVSSSMDQPDWQNTTVLRGDPAEQIAALKAQSGKDITITGSASLVHALWPTGLVDLIRVFVYPAVQGYGRRLFPDGQSARLTLMESNAFDGGVVLSTYRIA